MTPNYDPNNIYCDNKYNFLYDTLFIYETFDSCYSAYAESYSSYYCGVCDSFYPQQKWPFQD